MRKKFNRLTLIKFIKSDSKNRFFLFKCKCGNEKILRYGDVKSGDTKSCGCLRKEKRKTHGMRYTRFYNIWCGMLTRIRNSRCREYKYYGGRGLTVCNRWLVFDNFKNDMFDLYELHRKKFGEKDTTLERIDFTKGYKKSNCRWATRKDQTRNKTTSIIYNGETATDASLRLTKGRNVWLVFSRLRRGWSKERAFKEKVR